MGLQPHCPGSQLVNDVNLLERVCYMAGSLGSSRSSAADGLALHAFLAKVTGILLDSRPLEECFPTPMANEGLGPPSLLYLEAASLLNYLRTMKRRRFQLLWELDLRPSSIDSLLEDGLLPVLTFSLSVRHCVFVDRHAWH